jgi:aspartyl-tRNA(Asn)/glutamyl-tRNA(Gln) amidotransferase subunit C
MSVNRETVLHTSKLARLELLDLPNSAHSSGKVDGVAAGDKLELFARQMDQIVGYMDILKSADTTGTEPLFSPMRRTAPPREDEAALLYKREDELSNAPEQDQGFFVVPKIL